MSAAKLRARRAEIEERMRLLQAEYQILRNELDAIAYPVLRLPDEITSEVFTRYVEEKDSSPLRLLEICRSWREVAISTCQLWTRIRSPQLLPYWLPRTGGLPLDVKLVLRDAPEALAMLCQYSSQWECVELHWTANQPLPATVFSGPFPYLKQFSLTTKTTLPPLLADAPRLRELALGYGSLASEWNNTPSLMHLTKLNLTFETDKCFQLLTQVPNVEDLSVTTPYGVENREPDTPPTMSLILPRVHTVRFPVPSASRIMQYLTLPALENLSIALDDSDVAVWYPTPDLVQLLERSGCTLRKLNLQLEDTDRQAWDSFIEAVPLQAVRDLTLSEPDGQKLDFDDLFQAMAEGTLFPALESLKIVGYRFGGGLSPLIALLSARTDPADWQDVAKLRSVWLSFATGIQGKGFQDVIARVENAESVVARLGDADLRKLEVDLRTQVEWSSRPDDAGW